MIIVTVNGTEFEFENVLDDEFHIFMQICLDNGYDVLVSQKEDE